MITITFSTKILWVAGSLLIGFFLGRITKRVKKETKKNPIGFIEGGKK